MYAKGKNGSDKKAPPLPHPFQKINARQRGSVVPRLLEKNIVWATAYSIFVPCGLKIGDATFSKMCYVTSNKA